MTTNAYLVIKSLDNHILSGQEGDQLIMSLDAATELEVHLLVDAGYLKHMTDEEALAHNKAGSV
jgi:hypothetical protein